MGTTETSAGYNFVPLSKKVVFPEWGPRISQDIPFKDGISGTIECELEATSPIFVRNSGEAVEGESFFNVNGQVIIPGTSLKGMLRNVIEIAGFGKMGRVNDDRYGVRDLNNPKVYGKEMTQTVGGGFQPTAVAGWLSEDPATGAWHITPCDFARIEQEELERSFHGLNLGEKQTARNKYESFPSSLDVCFECGDLTNHQHSCGPLRYRRAYLRKDSNVRGTLVFTGQPGNRRAPGQRNNNGRPISRGKHMEFIFFNRQQDRLDASPLKKDFLFIHGTNGDPTVPNEEWGFWKRKLSGGEEIPIFFIRNGLSIKSMGLALMYRLPYEYSIGDLLAKVNNGIHLESQSDLAECMFGFVGEQERVGALKGRVHISHAVAIEAQPDRRINTVLGGPKPTYYPNYIEQPQIKGGRGDYKTMMEPDASLRGWKRYPARSTGAKFTPARDEQRNVSTQFVPLQSGAKFTFKVRVHNLRPEELGALLWALEWGGDPTLRHGLGMAKNCGQGQVKIKVSDADLRNCLGEKIQNLGIDPFVDWINSDQNVPGWHDTEQICQLLAMANPHKLSSDEQLTRFAQIEDPQRFAKLKGSRDNDRLNAILPPHVPYEGKKDTERFRNFEFESLAMKEAKKVRERQEAEQEKASRLRQVLEIHQWGVLVEKVLSRVDPATVRDEPDYAQAVREVAEKVRDDNPKKWTSDRDEKVAMWLESAGITWNVLQTAAPPEPEVQLSPEEKEMIEKIQALNDWGQWRSLNLSYDGLSGKVLEAARDKFEKDWRGEQGSNKEKKRDFKALKKALKNKLN